MQTYRFTVKKYAASVAKDAPMEAVSDALEKAEPKNPFSLGKLAVPGTLIGVKGEIETVNTAFGCDPTEQIERFQCAVFYAAGGEVTASNTVDAAVAVAHHVRTAGVERLTLGVYEGRTFLAGITYLNNTLLTLEKGTGRRPTAKNVTEEKQYAEVMKALRGGD